MFAVEPSLQGGQQCTACSSSCIPHSPVAWRLFQGSTCPAPCPLSDGPPWVGHRSLSPSWWTCGCHLPPAAVGAVLMNCLCIGCSEFCRFYRFLSAGIAPFCMTPEMDKTSFFFKAWSVSFWIFCSPIGKKCCLWVVLLCVSVMSEANHPFLYLWLMCL